MIERSAGTGLDDKNVENVSQATAKILRMLGQQGEVIVLCTVKPRFTGPVGGKELGPVNREARYIGVHFTLIYI